jgi:hypothetical protein
MKRSQGSFEYIIILAVIILIALIIVGSLSSFGIFTFRNKLQENANEINNLIRDVSVSYAISHTGYTQLGLRSVVDSKVIVYNVTIGGCLFDLNSTELYTSWMTYEKNCSGLWGIAGNNYDYSCSICYIDSKGILHKDAGRCFGFYEE